MLDLITTSEESHYENYRLQQMETRKFGSVPSLFERDDLDELIKKKEVA